MHVQRLKRHVPSRFARSAQALRHPVSFGNDWQCFKMAAAPVPSLTPPLL